ncbi:D-arabinitol 4-dehydrogenase [uncultured Aquitalea sp.]|uniref:D-arabinitol 4-dehydrogenase n=1 Tax=uncultured Aquitalea sp. TaxID=540272 RepID=UPI0025FDEA36|nr:D-arabinitol 4-dehydrogenase [uncultured Aquitalea sp.]
MSDSRQPYADCWLHIGAGSFHRAHQAWYLDQLEKHGQTPWELALANIRADMAPLLDKLAAQHGEYTLETISPAGEHRYEVIRAIRTILPWEADLASLIAKGAQAGTRVISFTVTEGGYYLDQHLQLDTANADLAADLNGGLNTIYGAIAAILRARSAAGDAPVTLLNCDNLRHNGERFRSGLQQFLSLRGETTLLAWVEKHTSSPNTMVDRITPRPTPEVVARVEAATGRHDPCAIMAEPFIQWVVEDNFIGGRPALEAVGVEMVASVLPYEEAKIRILNASHSCIAWAGTLIGLGYIHESTAVDSIRELAWRYVTHDVIPCLSPSPLDLAAYRDTVLDRFSNPYILDSNQRVAADGFSKVPGFIAPTLQQSVAAGRQPVDTAVLPALFLRFLQRWQAQSLPYDYQDGIMDASACRRMLAADDVAGAYAADPMLWGELAGTDTLRALLDAALTRVDDWYKLAEVPQH